MKKILGSLVFLSIFLTPFLQAGYTWTVTIDKTNYYEKEPFLVTFICQFDSRSPDIFIEFKPKSKDFVFDKLDFNDRVLDAKRVTTFRYVATAQKVGEKILSMDLLMRQTTDASITETILGRDNDKELVFTDTKVHIQSQPLTIKPIPKEAKITGKFLMETTFSKKHLKAFEPLQLKVKISGRGDLNLLKPFKFTMEKGKIFTQKAEDHYDLKENGYEGFVVWRYAMTSAKDFTLAGDEIDYFDTDAKRLKKLIFKKMQILVDAQGSTDALLDNIEFPPKAKPFNWKLLLNNSLYFFSGILFFIIINKIRTVMKKKKKPSKKFESINELLTYLIQTQRDKELLIEIENDMKNKKLKSLKSYLKELSKKGSVK